MRLWTLHPRHLDSRGLVALWREGLLARAVIFNKARGYRHHPQLIRFLRCGDPRRAIDAYLFVVLQEAKRRGFHFDGRKIRRAVLARKIPVRRGQVAYERSHLLVKLLQRDPEAARKLRRTLRPKINNVFKAVPGPTEPWEIRPSVPPTPDN